MWLEGKDLRVRTPIDLPLISLLVWILLTIPFSLNPEYSFGEWRKFVAQCLVFYWAVAVIREVSQRQQSEAIRFPFAWLECIRGNTHLPNVFLGVVIGTVLLASFALFDFIERGGNWQDRHIRAIAPGSDYNWLSTYLVLVMPIVVYCGITARSLRGKLLLGGALVLALCAQVASYTRAGWLSSVAQLVSWSLVARQRVFVICFILGIILVSGILIGMGQSGYQTDTLDMWTAETRIHVWKLGVEQIISHPLVGIGYGKNNFQPVLVDSPMGDSPMHLHNTFLMMGVGSGIPAFIFFVWTFICLGREFFSITNRRHWTDSETLRLCLGIVLVGFLCRNLFDYMFAGSLAYLFWILMAYGLESNERL